MAATTPWKNEADFARRVEAEWRCVDAHGLSWIHHAAREGTPDQIRALYALGASMNYVDKHGVTPLQFANGRPLVMDVLLQLGAALDDVDLLDITDRDIARWMRCVDHSVLWSVALRKVLEKSIHLLAPTQSWRAMASLQRSQRCCVWSTVVRSRWDPTEILHGGISSLIVITGDDCVDSIMYLAERHPKLLHHRDRHGQTALSYCQSDRAFKVLLRCGAVPSDQDLLCCRRRRAAMYEHVSKTSLGKLDQYVAAFANTMFMRLRYPVVRGKAFVAAAPTGVTAGISKLVQRLYSVVSVQAVHNWSVWEPFHENPKTNRRWMWHGTRKTDPVTVATSPLGVDPERAGEDNWMGRGSYFTESIEYVVNSGYAYTKKNGDVVVLLCEVIEGRALCCDTNKRKCPDRTSATGFDSLRGIVLPPTQVEATVVYERFRAYPAYVATFRLLCSKKRTHTRI